MSLQALPLIPAAKINPLPAAPAHLWPNLSPETQARIARALAELMRRDRICSGVSMAASPRQGKAPPSS